MQAESRSTISLRVLVEELRRPDAERVAEVHATCDERHGAQILTAEEPLGDLSQGGLLLQVHLIIIPVIIFVKSC